MLDAAAKTPLIGGGGINTFQHIGFAAPVSGVTQPYIVGGLLQKKNGAWSLAATALCPTDVAWVAWPENYGAPQELFE
jgi:hypothetical protein